MYICTMKKLIIAILIILLSGCTSTKYIEVPVDRTKIEYRDRTLVDTLIRYDSIAVKINGDTIFKEKYKYLYRTKEVKDTINVTDTVTIFKTVEVAKEVNKVNNWQIILMVLGGAAIALGLYKLMIFVKTWI